ncbi:hypothetical protein COU88_00160 [Candidatus Roizmanbacteria bacterium CG10_big_fil_rev_8_21_14_0_10_39_6]|uniref:Uncharacterized protein n=1 Tax=Candidatus Roizmanbacteria bacterium CG10_big_fil_rev_8_21_14_0_10_39_6 TaxID=1974853 RepID=A0A2M8KTS9_9BACT|nr:MAG: hypothetical protein COU88_00160 [Candidatus Roizmanbacteria bacterium CG10_big_fil_rev_8_21_14_0_10_39_6]
MIKKQDGVSYDTKTIITVLALIFVYPIGIVLMFVWMKWKMWVKLLIALPVTLILFGVFAVALLSALNPRESFNKGKCVRECGSNSATVCINACMRKLK